MSLPVARLREEPVYAVLCSVLPAQGLKIRARLLILEPNSIVIEQTIVDKPGVKPPPKTVYL